MVCTTIRLIQYTDKLNQGNYALNLGLLGQVYSNKLQSWIGNYLVHTNLLP